MPIKFKSKYDKYKYAKSFKLPKGFPNDPDSVKIRNKIFKSNGNGWWAKHRVDAIHIPKYWVVSRKFKLNKILQT
jgi:ubiquitin-protein ligase